MKVILLPLPFNFFTFYPLVQAQGLIIFVIDSVGVSELPDNVERLLAGFE